jgi:hypothetical protein
VRGVFHLSVVCLAATAAALAAESGAAEPEYGLMAAFLRPSAEGGLHVADVVEALRPKRDALAECYHQAFAQPGAPYEFTIKLSIGSDGGVDGADLTHGQRYDHAAELCVARELMSLTVPNPEEEQATRFQMTVRVTRWVPKPGIDLSGGASEGDERDGGFPIPRGIHRPRPPRLPLRTDGRVYLIRDWCRGIPYLPSFEALPVEEHPENLQGRPPRWGRLVSYVEDYVCVIGGVGPPSRPDPGTVCLDWLRGRLEHCGLTLHPPSPAEPEQLLVSISLVDGRFLELLFFGYEGAEPTASESCLLEGMAASERPTAGLFTGTVNLRFSTQ